MRSVTFPGLSLLLALPALTGCGSVETDDSADITGDIIDVYAPTTGITARPDTDSWTAIAALVAKDGGYTTIPGTLSPDGTFRIPGVPQGPYFLALTHAPPETIADAPRRTDFYATSARKLDLGATYSGRADTVAMTQPTFLELDATLTTPWTDGPIGNGDQFVHDSLHFFSRNASVEGIFRGPEDNSETPMSFNGDTKLHWNID